MTTKMLLSQNLTIPVLLDYKALGNGCMDIFIVMKNLYEEANRVLINEYVFVEWNTRPLA